MKNSALILLAALVMLTARCSSSLTVLYDYDRQEDFSQYHSFDFLPQPKDIQQETSDLVIKRIIASTTRQLEAKGLKLTKSKPDLLIAIHTEAKDKFNVTNWGYHYAPYDIYWRGYGYWHGGGIDVQQYEEGTLILDVIRADEKEMIWRGAASRALPQSPSPNKLDKIVNEAVAKILENFPPIK
jgi:hypothetical protein